MATVQKFICHTSKKVRNLALQYGWKLGIRYTDLRPSRFSKNLDFLDIDWKNYDFKKHLEAAKLVKPLMTVAQDITSISELEKILRQAEELEKFCSKVIIVPKDPKMTGIINSVVPKNFLLGFSVPTKHGETTINPEEFKRPVHLLGGRPDVQKNLSKRMEVFSFDCNRFTLDAKFGDYFDGEIFRPHPNGGYYNCIEDSFKNINQLWSIS